MESGLLGKGKGFDEKTFERISSAIDFTKQKIQLGIVLEEEISFEEEISKT